MQKIVINSCYGGFSLSHEAVMRYTELKGDETYGYVNIRKPDGSLDFENYEPYDKEKHTDNCLCIHYASKKSKNMTSKQLNANYVSNCRAEERDDPKLIQAVEELGDKANGGFSDLRIIEIPDDVKWVIDEYDGMESIEEEHKSWS